MKPRSTEDETNGLRYFPRMLDKIRLKAKGQLDPEYHENMGRGADRRLIKFLRVEYRQALRTRPPGGYGRGNSGMVLRQWPPPL